MKKQCSICGKYKKLKKFVTDIRYKYGVQGICKKCQQGNRRTPLGKISALFNAQTGKSKKRKHPAPDYTKQELIDWCLGQPLYHELHEAWAASGYSSSLAPSCDRKNNYKPYTLDNLQLVTWGENNQSGYADRKSGKYIARNITPVSQYTKEGVFVKHFVSAAEAARQTSTSGSDVTQCCKNKLKSAGGFTWKYKRRKI